MHERIAAARAEIVDGRLAVVDDTVARRCR
jgi:hypothetical protein